MLKRREQGVEVGQVGAVLSLQCLNGAYALGESVLQFERGNEERKLAKLAHVDRRDAGGLLGGPEEVAFSPLRSDQPVEKDRVKGASPDHAPAA